MKVFCAASMGFLASPLVMGILEYLFPVLVLLGAYDYLLLIFSWCSSSYLLYAGATFAGEIIRRGFFLGSVLWPIMYALWVNEGPDRPPGMSEEEFYRTFAAGAALGGFFAAVMTVLCIIGFLVSWYAVRKYRTRHSDKDGKGSPPIHSP